LAERRPAEPGRTGRLTRQAPGTLSCAGTVAATVALQLTGRAPSPHRSSASWVAIGNGSPVEQGSCEDRPGYVADAVLEATPLFRAPPCGSTQDTNNDELELQGGQVYLHLGARRDEPPRR
jgi:hypothetical protein